MLHPLATEAARKRDFIRTASGLGIRDAIPTLSTAAAHYQNLAKRLSTADLFWVSGDMAKSALDASQDCPGMIEADMPADAGIIAFAEPLPPFQLADGLYLRDGSRAVIQHADPVPVDAILWVRDGAGLQVNLCCTPARLPLPLFAAPIPLVPFVQFTLGAMTADFDTLESVVLDNAGQQVDADGSLGALALLSTIWVLMMTPTMAVRETLTATVKAGKKNRGLVPGDVTLIDLRPAAHRPATSAGDRHLTVRHRVRGHWRNQAHGPGRASRKIIWVPDYIKGPAGAPLVSTERVYVWRR